MFQNKTRLATSVQVLVVPRTGRTNTMLLILMKVSDSDRNV